MKFSGILLAAGLSKRFGSQKLFTELPGGEILFLRAVKIHLAAGLRPFVIVVSEDVLKKLPEILNRSDWQISKKGPEPWSSFTSRWGKGRVVVNGRPEDGMALSLKTGLKCLSKGEKEGSVLFSLADLPLLTAETIRSLMVRHKNGNKRIVLPVYKGRTGHPVVIDGVYLREHISNVQGDRGLRNIIRNASPEDVDFVSWPDGTVTADIDVVSDLEILKNEMVKNEN